jgi:tRNA-splicing ligase RtcB
MKEISGKYATAKVYTGNVEESAVEQIALLCDQPFVADSHIRIMPDVHWGNGCCVGTTMLLNGKVVPNLVGVDIGCGMYTVKIKEEEIDCERLDSVIRKQVPSGFNIHKNTNPAVAELELDKLKCLKAINIDRAGKSLGTLGGGNHFIEADTDDEGNIYLVIHSGSRNLGKQAAEYYQRLAASSMKEKNDSIRNKIIEDCKANGTPEKIEESIAFAKLETITKNLEYLEGQNYKDYLHDMKIIQRYATENRKEMMKKILVGMRLTMVDEFTTIHNYIDTENGILRKGSVSAYKNEKLLIPINMRDGSLICVGKGNEDWNYSAPHGAGRLMSRTKAKEVLNFEEYQDTMKDIYTTSVSLDTIDEAPMVYKPIQEIIDNIGETVDILANIKPMYNFKAS